MADEEVRRAPRRRDMRRRENTGSTARDHLANERTYLAWLRTGFGTAVLGVGIGKLIGEGEDWRALTAGVLLIVLGVLMIVYGTTRYFRVVRAVDEGLMEVGRAGPIFFGAAAAIITFVVALLLLI